MFRQIPPQDLKWNSHKYYKSLGNFSSLSDIMQAEKSWVSRLRNQKLATIGQGTVHERLWE